MDKYGTTTRDLSIKADLNKIIKYHPASKIYLNQNTEKDYQSIVSVKVIAKVTDTTEEILPDYNYTAVSMKASLSKEDSFNLLVLVKNMIQMEWGYFETFYKKQERPRKDINLHATIIKHLQELQILTSILEEGETDQVVTKLNTTKTDDYGRRLNADKQVVSSSPTESKQIIELMIENRIQLLSNPEYAYYQFHTITTLNSQQLSEAIKSMSEPFDYLNAQSLFCKYVVETLIDYLKTEVEQEESYNGFSESQGALMYTLLVVFNLINPKVERNNDKQKSDRQKANYIHSLLKEENKDKNFFRFDDVTEWKELTFDQSIWYKKT